MANETNPKLILEFLSDLLGRGLFYHMDIRKDHGGNLETITLVHRIPSEDVAMNVESYRIVRRGKDNTEVVNNMITHHLNEGVFLNSTFVRGVLTQDESTQIKEDGEDDKETF
jgi:aryl-alcohol dehydrogenase-like predicted oxidoreductase